MAMTIEQVIQDALAESGVPASVGEIHSVAETITAHLTQPAQAVDVTDADVEAAGAAYFEQQWDMLPPRSKAIYQNALRRALKSFATRALAGEQAGWRDGCSAVPDDLIRLTVRALRDVDMEMSATGRATMRFSQLASDLNGMLPASPTPDKETQR